MSATYQATFRWPHSDASNVIVTGSFDSWSCSHYLSRSPSGHFQGTVQVPWGDKIAYKYIVDGRWTTTDDQPTELDPMGNLNNVLRAPARPSPTPAPAPAPTSVPWQKPKPGPEAQTTSTVLNGFVATAKQAAVTVPAQPPVEKPVVEAPAPESAPTPEASIEPAAAPAPEPAPASPEPEVAKEQVAAAVVPLEPITVAPIIPVPIVRLNAEPHADVSELKTLPVESSTLTPPEQQPSTHSPSPALVPPVEEKPATNGVAPAEEKPAANGTATEEKPAVNGTPAEEQPATNGTPVEDKPATNGTTSPAAAAAAEQPTANGTSAPAEKPAVEQPAEKPATNGVDVKYATVGGKSPSPKKMRFPSFASRHSRARSSLESAVTPSASASELGEKPANGLAKENGLGSGKETLSGRLKSGTQREKRRSSIFGKLKDVFGHAHPKAEASA